MAIALYSEPGFSQAFVGVESVLSFLLSEGCGWQMPQLHRCGSASAAGMA
jgi:hypothetical protein